MKWSTSYPSFVILSMAISEKLHKLVEMDYFTAGVTHLNFVVLVYGKV